METLATQKSKCTLVADTRESHVTVHMAELEKVNLIRKQITVADYAIFSSNNKLLALIERKTLADYADSLRGGKRHENRHKMLALRKRTNCVVLYLIEGPPFPKPTDVFGRMPYRHIQSSIFHIMVRDQITVMWTRDSLHTAQTLAAFVFSMDTLDENNIQNTEICDNDLLNDANINANINATAVDQQNNAIDIDNNINHNIDDEMAIRELNLRMITEIQKAEPALFIRTMWMAFHGISAQSASSYMAFWRLRDIVMCEQNNLPPHFDQFRLAGGRKPTKRVIDSFRNHQAVHLKLLSRINGISVETTMEILKLYSLPQLINMCSDDIAKIKIGIRKKCLGKTIANRILFYFDYIYVPPQNG